MKEFKDLAKKAINLVIDPSYPDPYGWPPTCAALLYQPERPVYIKDADNNTVSVDE